MFCRNEHDDSENKENEDPNIICPALLKAPLNMPRCSVIDHTYITVIMPISKVTSIDDIEHLEAGRSLQPVVVADSNATAKLGKCLVKAITVWPKHCNKLLLPCEVLFTTFYAVCPDFPCVGLSVGFFTTFISLLLRMVGKPSSMADET